MAVREAGSHLHGAHPEQGRRASSHGGLATLVPTRSAGSYAATAVSPAPAIRHPGIWPAGPAEAGRRGGLQHACRRPELIDRH